MAVAEIKVGAKFETATPGEVYDEARRAAADTETERLRGVKAIRFMSAIGTPAASALTLGGHLGGGYLTGPEQGFVWSVRLFVIEGLTASSTTPDVMNILRGGSGRIIWQLNGNQFAQDWGRGVIMLRGGEALAIQNVGNLAATGNILFHGEAWEAPAELAGKLF